MKTKKILFILSITIIAFGAMFFNIDRAGAQEKKPVYFFYGDGCPHCHDEEIFWNKIKNNYPAIDWLAHETWSNQENYQLLLKTTKEKIGREFGSVPVTVIGNDVIIGFRDENTTGEKIKQALDKYLGQNNNPATPETEKLKLPLLGEINLKNISLPALTAVLGTIDGFNPCSMWALLILITILINSKDKKKMWLVGWTYIITSAISYFLFLSAWLNAFFVVGYLKIIQIIIGLLALGISIYFFKDYLKNRKKADLTCEVTSEKTKSKIIARLEKTLLKEKTLAIVIGIAAIAFSINLIELLCSAGIPAVYTQILSQSQLPKLSYYLYLLAYDFFYMLDDIVVLLIAGFTFKIFIGNQKYAKYSHLIGALILFILGAIMLLKPSLLMLK
ncbi:MAG TPA: hypothetical protein PKZ16_02450 [bacterium]|nr:hypothetical protein [bacterium]HPL95815.1 hypothetical protein [bacterium]